MYSQVLYSGTITNAHMSSVLHRLCRVDHSRLHSVSRVARDELFIQEMIGKLCSHWRRAILPELLTRRLELDKCNKTSIPVAVCPSTSRSPQHIQRPTYCICRTSDDSGDMVACDKCDEWFHLRCLKLTVLPRSKKWYCKKCKKAE